MPWPAKAASPCMTMPQTLLRIFCERSICGAVNAVAGLLGAGTTHGDRIDGFEVAGIRNQVNVELLAVGGGVHAGRADVIFHVTCAEDAARINVFKTRDHFVNGLAGNVRHDVQATAMAHGHDGIDTAQIAGGIENGIEQRDQRGVALEREALAAEVTALQDLFEKIGANQAFEDFFLIDLEFGTFHALGDPIAALEFRDVQEFHADGAAVVAAGFFGIFTGEAVEIGTLERGEEAEGVESGFVEAPAAEKIEDAFAFGVPHAVGRRRFLGGPGGLFGSECHTVSHGCDLLFCHKRNRDAGSVVVAWILASGVP